MVLERSAGVAALVALVLAVTALVLVLSRGRAPALLARLDPATAPDLAASIRDFVLGLRELVGLADLPFLVAELQIEAAR
ncbi:hypothetical protein ABQE45_10425 [Mycobacteroides chelonae]